ncbi:MAG: hypothetical protein FWE59_05770, partial [Oscillospiraceae bacterium]|nr:hypothetical protein [Oscillospiraceae bacterium]
MKNRVMTCGLACVMLLAMIAVGAVVLPTHALFEKVIKHDGVTLTPEIIVTDIQNDGWRYRDPIEEPYMSGVDVATVTIHIYLSALERILVEPTLKLSFGTLDIGDAREIANPNPRFTPGGLGDQLIERQPFYYDTAANEAYWYFEDLSPATGTTISISFLMRSPYTPDGYELNITAELYEVEGDFRSTDDLAIKWVCERQTIEKYVESVDYISIRPGLVADDEGIGRVAYNVLGGSDLDVDGIVDDDSEIPVRFSFRDELPESLSYREIDKSKTVTVDTLPEMIVGGVPVRAVFDPALNDERWELQPDGITVVAVGDVSDLVLLFPRAEIGELYLNRVERTYTLAFPWGDEEATYSSKSACFVAINAPAVSITDLEKSFLKGAVAPLTPSGLTFTTRGDNLLYVDASREAIPYLINNDYWWVNQINNNLGDENIYVNLRDVVITDDALDENMMFTKFLLYMPSNLSATIEYRSAADGLWRPLVTVASTDLTFG